MFFQACSLTCLSSVLFGPPLCSCDRAPFDTLDRFQQSRKFSVLCLFLLFGGCCHGDESCAPVWETAVEAVCGGSCETELWMYMVHKTHTGLQVKILWWKNSEKYKCCCSKNMVLHVLYILCTGYEC